MQLDEIDIKILRHLQRDARMSNVELAGLVGLSPAPCLRRVKALEDAGVIQQYVALLNPRAIGFNVTVLVQVSLDRQVAERFQNFEQAVLDRPEVLECDVTTGPSDFVMRVVVQDVAAYERFQREFLSRIDGVSSTNSSFALKQVKYRTEFPLPEFDEPSKQAVHGRPRSVVGRKRAAAPKAKRAGAPGRK